MTNKNAPQGEALANQPDKQSHHINPGTKEHVAYNALLQRSYNRFEAARELGDWCLNSTTSTLQSKGVTVSRRTETVRGRNGKPTRCCRYWIPAHVGSSN